MQTIRGKTHRRSARHLLRLAIVCTFVLALLLPTMTVAQDAPGDVPDGTPADALTLDQTPTAEPTVEPTVAPTLPAETPTETPAPTEVPATETVAPTVEATPTPTATATPSQTATPSPTPSPTATPKTSKSSVQTNGLVAAAAVISCTIPSGIPTVAYPNYITFKCVGDAPLKVYGDALTSGWQWAYSVGADSGPSTWYTGPTDSGSASGNIDTVYIYLRPTASVMAGATGSLTVSVRKPNGDIQSSATVTAYAGVTSANFALSCTPNPITVPTSTNGVVNCSLSGVGLDPSAVVSVTAVNVSSLANWTIIRAPATGTLTGTASPFNFTLTLTPVCGAAVNPPAPNITITTSLDFHGTAVTGPSTSITAKHGATTVISASISGSSMTWSNTYSFTPQSVTGSLTYRTTASGCAGWNIQLSATNFAYTGSFSGAAIPNGNIAITPGSVSAVSGSTTNITPGSTGSLGSALKVLSAIENSGIGTYDQSIAIGVTIPGGARVGTYTSTLTVTAASGP